MTIDEAIKMYKDISNTDTSSPRYCMRPCYECEQQCGQIAEWLEELKLLREEKSEFQIIASDNYEIGYNKAIDDFVKWFTSEKYHAIDGNNKRPIVARNKKWVDAQEIFIAEQLKAGENQ